MSVVIGGGKERQQTGLGKQGRLRADASLETELGEKQRGMFAVSFGEEVMGFLSVCLSEDGFFVPFSSGESYCAENMSRGKLFEQNEALWKGNLAVSGFLEIQNGLLELKKNHLWKINFNTANSAYIWFLIKPHWYHS